MEMSKPQPLTLRGWKEIAAYMGRDVRTVQRWEQRGLPIRRVPGSERGAVYTLSADIDAWLLSASAAAAKPPEAADPATVAPAQPSLTGAAGGLSAHALMACSLLLCIAVATVVSLARYAAAVSLRPPAESVAYAGDPAYLQAMHLFEKRTPGSLLASEQQFRTLLRLHPHDAPAWSGLAQTLTIAATFNLLPINRAQTEIREAAQQALRLDPQLSEPHAVLGFSDYFWLGKPVEAEREFSLALQAPRRSSVSYSLYGTVLTYEARYSEADRMLAAALDLQPTAVHIRANQALLLGLRGERDRALKQLHALEGGDAAPIVEFDEAVLCLITPRMPLAYLDHRIHLNKLGRTSTEQLESARATLLRSGERSMWQSLALAPSGTWQHAEANAALGKTDVVLSDLNRIQLNAPCIGCEVASKPVFAAMRNDARFQHYLQQQATQ